MFSKRDWSVGLSEDAVKIIFFCEQSTRLALNPRVSNTIGQEVLNMNLINLQNKTLATEARRGENHEPGFLDGENHEPGFLDGTISCHGR